MKMKIKTGYIDRGLKTNSEDRKRTWTNSKINRSKALKKLGGKCVNCGENNPLVLEFNHLNEKQFSSPPLIVKAVMNGLLTEHDIDIRCANCNILYEYEKGHRFDWTEIYENTQSYI